MYHVQVCPCCIVKRVREESSKGCMGALGYGNSVVATCISHGDQVGGGEALDPALRQGHDATAYKPEANTSRSHRTNAKTITIQYILRQCKHRRTRGTSPHVMLRIRFPSSQSQEVGVRRTPAICARRPEAMQIARDTHLNSRLNRPANASGVLTRARGDGHVGRHTERCGSRRRC